MTDLEKYTKLKQIFWDYNVDKLPLDKVVNMEFNSIGSYEFNLVFNRMLERLNWYDLLDILGIDFIKKILTAERICKLRNKELKDRYERIRRILFKESLSISGWDPEYRKRIKATLLSNRWYSA